MKSVSRSFHATILINITCTNPDGTKFVCPKGTKVRIEILPGYQSTNIHTGKTRYVNAGACMAEYKGDRFTVYASEFTQD